MGSNEYLHAVVRPMLDRFLCDPTARDLALATCILTFHYCEYVGTETGLPKSDVEDYFRKLGPEFDAVHGIATAAKHTVVSNERLKFVGLSEGDISEGLAAAFSDGTYFSDGTTFSDSKPSTTVETQDGILFDVAHTAETLFARMVEFEAAGKQNLNN